MVISFYKNSYLQDTTSAAIFSQLLINCGSAADVIAKKMAKEKAEASPANPLVTE